MAVRAGMDRMWFTAPAEHIDYLRSHWGSMYSDARRPGDVLAFALAKLVRGEQDPHAFGRVTDRIRIIQDRVGSWEHLGSNLMEAQFDRPANFYRRPESDMEFGWRSHIDHAKRALVDAWQSSRYITTEAVVTGHDDPVYHPQEFVAVQEASSPFRSGAFAAAERLRGFCEGLEAVRRDPSVMMAADALDPFRPGGTWAPRTATVPLLERIEDFLLREPGADLQWMHSSGGSDHPDAVQTAIAYLRKRGLLEVVGSEPGRYRWTGRGE